MNQLIQQIGREHIARINPINKNDNFNVGDDVAVQVAYGKTPNVTRSQIFEGRCIGIRNRNSTSATIKVLKLGSIKVIRIFPIYSPSVKITVATKGYARRAKLNYLQYKTGKQARIRIKKIARNKKNTTL